jgi:hypothetical protein
MQEIYELTGVITAKILKKKYFYIINAVLGDVKNS